MKKDRLVGFVPGLDESDPVEGEGIVLEYVLQEVHGPGQIS